MEADANRLAQVFKAASKEGMLEKSFRDGVEQHLIQLAGELHLDLVPRTEVTMGSSGRTDTIYNASSSSGRSLGV